MNEVNEDVKVKIFIKGKDRLLANAVIYLDIGKYGTVALKGFQIWKSTMMNGRLGEYINISPPTKSIQGKLTYLYFFENSNGWYLLEKQIYNAYINQKTSM